MMVERWMHYLEYDQFIIKTDHEIIKFLLEQKLYTPIQMKGLTKLLELRFIILYRKMKENMIVDALSKKMTI
jgi:hypothetical protein